MMRAAVGTSYAEGVVQDLPRGGGLATTLDRVCTR